MVKNTKNNLNEAYIGRYVKKVFNYINANIQFLRLSFQNKAKYSYWRKYFRKMLKPLNRIFILCNGNCF